MLEEVNLEETIDDIEYEEVPEDDTDSESEIADFSTLLSTLKQKQTFDTAAPALPTLQPESVESVDPNPSIQNKPILVEDFIRNFLIRHNMKNTLREFQHEWYESKQKSKITSQEITPDIYQQKEGLETEIIKLKQDLSKMGKITCEAKGTWERLRKERDYHRMHHRRVAQEKNEIYKKLKRLTKHSEEYEPVFNKMRQKYEKALKEKMLMRLDRDKIKVRLQSLEAQMDEEEATRVEETASSRQRLTEAPEATELSSKKFDSILTDEDRTNPYANMDFEPTDVNKFSLHKTYKGHTFAISRLTLHPKKDIIATVSDDCTWKMWSVPNGDLIMSGEGHKEWLSDCHFHPNGTLLATSSGDATVKIWDFLEARCTATFTDHTQAVWSCKFHDSGDFLVSSSMDHTARLWDVNSERCRQTFRGHVDSVNYITFQPYSNTILTCSGDKTLSLWDLRSGLCVQTLFGHKNAINHCSFNSKGNEIVSADADGIVKTWDCRMVTELQNIVVGNRPATHAIFDQSGQRIIVANDDASIKIYESNGNFMSELAGHEDGVNCLTFDHKSRQLITASSDCTFRIWQ